MSFPGRWLYFAAKVVSPLNAHGAPKHIHAPLLELGFDMDNPSNLPTETGWLVLKRLAQLNAPHLEEALAQKMLGQQLAWALKEQNLLNPSHLRLAKCLPSPMCMLGFQKLARGTPFAYVYSRECKGVWKLSFEEGMLLPLSLGLWEVLSEWLGKRWVVSMGPQPAPILFVHEG